MLGPQGFGGRARERGEGPRVWEVGGDWKPTDSSCGVSMFPSCFPVVPLSSISSCFQAIKFFPGEIRVPPVPPRVCHV